MLRRRSWTSRLENAFIALVPTEYVDVSPFPDLFQELVHVLGDAEDESSQENYCKALTAGAIYVAICLSLYVSVHHPREWETDKDVSPILQHYLPEIKQMWDHQKTKTDETFAFMEGVIHGIAAVICLGYDEGKQYLQKPPC